MEVIMTRYFSLLSTMVCVSFLSALAAWRINIVMDASEDDGSSG